MVVAPIGPVAQAGALPGAARRLRTGRNAGAAEPMDDGIIHDGAQYRVVHRRVSDDPLTVVFFESLLPTPSRLAPPTAQEFFVRRGINFVGIRPAQNDWYQQEEIFAALAAVRRATPGARLVGYGGSMGGYGAINFAAELGLASLLAICPQVSIARAVVPFERRWAEEAAAITFRHDKIATSPRIRHGFIMFDPLTDDRLHAAAILAHHDLTPLAAWFTGHEQLRVLTQTGVAADIIIGLLRGQLGAADAVRRLRRARRDSNICWLGLAKRRLRRGEIAAALRAIERAEAAPLPDPFDAAVTRGEILRRLGRGREAAALIGGFLDQPAFAALARWQLDYWRTTAPAAPWWRRLLERSA